MSLLGPGKVSFERLTPKRARKLRCGTQKWARKLNSNRNYGTELNHGCGKLAPSPLACFPLSPLILLPCACFIGYTYRILHGKCGRTVFSYELLTSDMKEWDFWYKNSDLGKTVPSIFHAVLCLLDTETFIIDSASLLFQIFLKCLNLKKISLHTAKLTWQRKRRIAGFQCHAIQNRSK